jgi:aminodeoxyfutalosine synthase
MSFGVDDGTIDDTTKIYSLAGSEEQHPAMNTYELVSLIKNAGQHPLNEMHYTTNCYWSDHSFEEDTAYRGYVGSHTK